MKQSARLAVFATVIGAAVACAQRAQPPAQTGAADKERMIVAAKALDQRFQEAYNAGDVDAVMACYWNSPNLVTFPPGTMEVRGWDALRADFAQGFTAMPGATLEMTDSNYEVLGNAVISWGTWRMTIPSGSAAPTVVDGRYTDVKADHDGTWLYMLDHASVPMSPPQGKGGAM
jgi:ketosteroid isomerase-like protein